MAYYSTLRRTLANLSSRRSFFHYSFSSTSLSRLVAHPNSRFASALPKQRPTVPAQTSVRFNTSLSDSEPRKHDEEDGNAAPKWAHGGGGGEETLIDGCDFEHWLVIMKFGEEPKPSEEEMIRTYVSTLAEVVGSEEEAKKKIYSVSTVPYTGFGALLSRELSRGLKGLPGVLWVLPDSYLDVPTKDYGGDLFVDGKVIHRPEYRFSNGPEWPMASDFDEDDFKQEDNELEMQSELLNRLRKAMRSRKKDPRLRTKKTSKGPAEGKEDLGADGEETQEVVDELEGTEASKGLHEIFSKMKEVKHSEIEPVQSSEGSDWPFWEDDYVEQTEDCNNPLPDLNKVKEAIRTFRLGSKLSKDDDVDRPAEDTDCPSENSEPINSEESEKSVEFQMPRPDLDKLRETMNALRREPKKSPSDDMSKEH